MRLGMVLVLGSALLAGSAAKAMPDRFQADQSGLTAFQSEAALEEFLERNRIEVRGRTGDQQVDDIVVTGSRVTDSITNVQEAGVDEGGIVKASGNNLIILRRGRLFSVSLAGPGVRPVASINAYPPGVDASRDWYDEMLVVDDWVVVIGYSYGRGGTEINRFRLAPDGGLSFHDAYHLRSGDYYSGNNSSSRLIGDTLVFYAPYGLGWRWRSDEELPAMRAWRDKASGAFQPIYRARDIYMAPQIVDGSGRASTLHTVIRCPLTAQTLNCAATGVLGSGAQGYYVSAQAVYLWTAGGDSETGAASSVYRMPLDGGRPQAVRTRGAPIDQFSFREDSRRQTLDVLVRWGDQEDGQWERRDVSDAVALLRLPLSRFGDGTRAMSAEDYRSLPALPYNSWSHRNRFVGRSLLYSSDVSVAGSDVDTGVLHVVSLDDLTVKSFDLPEVVDRIEALGDDALVVGGEEDLTMRLVRLGRNARLAGHFVLPQAQEAESRSHGFFYRPDAAGRSAGLLGLPVIREDEKSAEMVFVRRSNRGLSSAGVLSSRLVSDKQDEDACVVSCFDWYGNARPIFLRGRVFALLGYELVEGREENGRIREIGRSSFAPREDLSRPGD
ncbi:beta-propeller domain-containing protein [Brevundimonas sp.]|uniref:beta-propeller domain-containing protein n=1 Tax=Brevundimonas sp. TaxID=1871086 RepID=UPI0025C24BED|nr:beta-propeller domain-containing protein [Brevundimonas sp.]